MGYLDLEYGWMTLCDWEVVVVYLFLLERVVLGIKEGMFFKFSLVR